MAPVLIPQPSAGVSLEESMAVKKVFRLFVLAGLWMAGFSAFLSAATPQGIIYQGTLRKDGTIYTGSVPMIFTITNSGESATYWTSGSTDVYVSAGLFRYLLGTPNETNFAAIDWQAINPYLKVTVDGNVLPLEPLLSSPYALHALTSATSAGAKGAFTVVDGNIVISTTGVSRGIIFQDGTRQITAGGAAAWAFSGNNLYTTNTGGNVGISSATPSYRLVISSGAGEAGTILMVSTGASSVFAVTGGGVYANHYYGDGSGLSGVSAADTLGTHIATTTLNMNGNQIINVASLTVTGVLGMDSPMVRFAQNVTISSAAASVYGGLAISTNVYLVPGAKYYGNASALSNLPETDPFFTAHISSNITGAQVGHWDTVYAQSPGYAKINSAQTFTGVNTFSSTASFTAQNETLPGVYISSGLIISAGDLVASNGNVIVSNGNIGIGVPNPQAQLDVAGGIRLGSTNNTVPGTMRYNGAFEGYTGSGGWKPMNGTISLDNSALWMGSGNNIYTGNISSNIAIGSADADISKLRVTGDTSDDSTNAFLAENSGPSPLLTIRNDGKVWIGPVTVPGARLDVQGGAGDSYLQIWRNSTGDEKASISNAGELQADGSLLTGVLHTETDPVFTAQKAAYAKVDSSQTFTGSNTFSSTAAFTAQNDILPGMYISSGLVIADGNVGIGIAGAATRLDVQAGAGPDTQIWRNSGGTIVSSMSAAGVMTAVKFIGDGSAITGVSGSDNLGNHTATTTLNLATFDMIGVSTITVSSITSAGAGLVISTNIFTNGNIVSSNFAGSGKRCIYADSSGMLQPESDDCGNTSGMDNLGNHIMTTNLVVGNHWISNDGSSGGLTVSVSSNVGVGIAVAETRLDVQGAADDSLTQIWRNSGGTIISSMSAAGIMAAAKFKGDGSLLTNVPGSDNLGDHTATATLNINSNQIINIASAQFGSNIVLSPASAADYGGVYFSTHVYLPAGAKYYGDGSGLVNLPAAYAKVDSSQTFTGANTFSSTAAFTAQNANLPGLYISSGLIVSNGNVVVSNGGITLGPTGENAVGGTIRYNGGLYSGSTGAGSWTAFGGSFSSDSSALWTGGGNTIYTTGLSSSVAIGSQNPGVSRLRVTGGTNSNSANAFLAENLDQMPIFAVRNDGNVGVGTTVPATRLDVQSAVSDSYTQIWRDSSGNIISSMSADGVLTAVKFIGDGSALSGITSGVSGFANPAIENLDMAGQKILNVSTITAFGASVQFTTNVYVGGHAAFGNAASSATIQTSTAVFMDESFGDANQDSYVLSAHGKVDHNVAVSDIAIYGGSFSVETNQVPSSYSFPSLTGVVGNAMHKNAGTLSYAYGVSGMASQSGGTITNAYGGIFRSIAGGAATPAITNAYGVFAGNSVRDLGAYITSSYAIYASMPDSIGHIDNNYGLYIEDQSGFGSSQNFNFYSKGDASKNYFGGSVGIGVEVPIAQLQISTIAGASFNMLVISTGASNVIRMTGAGEIYATKYYGDGSALTNLPAAGGGFANPADTDLAMGAHNITGVGNTISGGELTLTGNVQADTIMGTSVGASRIKANAMTVNDVPLEIGVNTTSTTIRLDFNSGSNSCVININPGAATCATGTLMGANNGKALCLVCN